MPVTDANGLGLRAIPGEDYCRIVIQYPSDTDSKWKDPKTGEPEGLSFDFNLCEAVASWEQITVLVIVMDLWITVFYLVIVMDSWSLGCYFPRSAIAQQYSQSCYYSVDMYGFTVDPGCKEWMRYFSESRKGHTSLHG
uniref:Uncharacterized protein n=1 Tax=Oryza barthii TaxID=65489 RepID=A0A0D3EZW0_9ORYZ